jgi:hydrogenase expression/formation protein HypC
MCLGIPGQIVEITDVTRQLAMVDVSGVQREVSLECVVDDYHPLERCVGHWVLVHVGFAMSLINEGEAEATLKVLRELGEVQAELLAMKESSSSPPSSLTSSPLPELVAQT